MGAQVPAAAGITKQAVRLIETGRDRRQAENLQALADILGIDKDRLLNSLRDPREREMADLEEHDRAAKSNGN